MARSSHGKGALNITSVVDHPTKGAGYFLATANDIAGKTLELVISTDSLDKATAHAHHPDVEADFLPVGE